jgi:hypothetical protein
MKNTESYRLTNADIFRRDGRYAGVDHRWFEPSKSYEDLMQERLKSVPNSVIELFLTSLLILGGFAVVAIAYAAGAVSKIAVIALPIVILTLATKWILLFLGVALPNEALGAVPPWEFLGMSFGVYVAAATGVVFLLALITPAVTSFTSLLVGLPFRLASWGIVACTVIPLLF